MEQIWQLLVQNGVTINDVQLIQHAYLILIMVPIVTTILAIFRYIVGIKSPSIFAVLILTFTFLELGFQRGLNEDFIQGLKYGSLLYFIVLIIATIAYALIKKFRMHYIPKMSIVFTCVSVGYILLILITRMTNTASLILSNTFVLIVIATLAENMASTYARKDFKYSLDLSLRTYIIALFCFIVISLDVIRSAFLTYPYLIILVVIINIYIGKFKGLRLTEYFRFKTILFSQTQTDEQNKSNPTK